jgi:virginiamycin B lyase
MSAPYRRRFAAGGLLAGFVLALGLAAPAVAQIYWANESGTTISRASLDGQVVEPNFITGANAPRGVAIDGSFVYWTNADATGSIGRANLDGTSPSQTFVTTAGPPQGLAVDNNFIFWTQVVSAAGEIGRARLSSPGTPNQSFVPTDTSPCGVASDADENYWANGGTPGSLGDSHGGAEPEQDFITQTSNPCGVARADGFVYWTNRSANSIGRAEQDGSEPVQDFIPLSTTTAPCGVAVDGQHIYWTTASNAIGRADLDGGNLEEDFITDATAVKGPCGIAVTPTQEVTPSSYAFPDTPVGDMSYIDAFLVVNHGSSVLDVTDVSLVGRDPGDFAITGDGCTRSVTPAGNGCVVNVRFTPTVTGPRAATLRVTSTASNSPTGVALTGNGSSSSASPESDLTARCAKLRAKLHRRERLDARGTKKPRARRKIRRRIRSLGC